MYNLIETTNGKFEVIATGMSYVDAENQAMFLEAYEEGTFRAAMQDTKEAYDEYQRSAVSGSSWDWV